MDARVLAISSVIPFTSKHVLKCKHPFNFKFPSIGSISITNRNSHFKQANLMIHRTKSRLTRGENDSVFSEEAYEAERLRLDAVARKSMAEKSSKEVKIVDDQNSKAWKWILRKRVWDMMEAENIAQFPRPVHHRIPNFVGAPLAANKLSELETFKTAKCVKVNPDTPQKQVRFLTLNDGKKLLTPQPRLRTGFFSVLESSMLSPSTIKEACTSVGVAKYGRPIGLDENIKVDLIVIGSVAVDPKTGARLGKGEGFAELEYGMLRYMGSIDDSTLVVTSGVAKYQYVWVRV